MIDLILGAAAGLRQHAGRITAEQSTSAVQIDLVDYLKETEMDKDRTGRGRPNIISKETLGEGSLDVLGEETSI